MKFLSSPIIAFLLLPTTTHGRDHDVPADKTKDIRPQIPKTVAPSSRIVVATAAPIKPKIPNPRRPPTTTKPRGPTLGPHTESPTFQPCGNTVTLTIAQCFTPPNGNTVPCTCHRIDEVDFLVAITNDAITLTRLDAFGVTDFSPFDHVISTGFTDASEPNFALNIVCGNNPLLLTAFDKNGNIVCTEVFNFVFPG